MTSSRYKFLLDKIGICTSSVCIVHCALLPLFLIFGSTSTGMLLEIEWLETLILSLAAIIGAVTFTTGYIRHKKSFVPILFISGLMLLINGEMISFTWLATIVTLLGSFVIIYAHYENVKQSRYGAGK